MIIKIKDEPATDKTKLAIRFNSHDINIVENTSDVPPVIQVKPGNKNEDNITVKAIVRQYENYSSIIKIKNTTKNPSFKFDILLDYEFAILQMITQYLPSITVKAFYFRF